MGSGSTQEGCNLNRDVMVEVIKQLDQALKSKNMDYVKIAVADETQINEAITTQNYFRDEGISSLISKVNVHGYWVKIIVTFWDTSKRVTCILLGQCT